MYRSDGLIVGRARISSQQTAMRRSGQLHNPTTENARLVIDNSTDVINLRLHLSSTYTLAFLISVRLYSLNIMEEIGIDLKMEVSKHRKSKTTWGADFGIGP